MVLNCNSAVPISPSDIDTFIALDVQCSQEMIKTDSLQSPLVMSLLKDLSVLDINKTLSSLKLALAIVFNLVSKGEKILFVRSRTMNFEVVNKFVSKTNQVFVSKPIGGILSNWSTFSHVFCRIGELTIRVRLLKNQKLKRILIRQLSKWTKHFVGFSRFETLPKAVVVSCDEQVKLIIKEANKLKIPVIGFADIASSRVGVDFVVPVCSFSKPTSLFVYRMIFVACSIANMAYGKKAISSLVRNDLSLLKDYNLHLNLFSSCLHFKTTILEPIKLQTVRNRQVILLSNVVRNLELKLVLHWLLSISLPPSTRLKTIVRYVTISQLRMIRNGINLSCFSRKLIVNFRMIWTL
ncbi:MAG: 30S ribosomal protein S2, partial [Candidatus Hodgkinia cicadicola]